MSHPHPDLGRPPRLPRNGLRITGLGGLGEIGRNMTVFEHAGRLLIVDCGVLFPEPDQPGVDLILPDFSSLEGRLHLIEAVVITHAHEDHIGAIPYLLRERAARKGDHDRVHGAVVLRVRRALLELEQLLEVAGAPGQGDGAPGQQLEAGEG